MKKYAIGIDLGGTHLRTSIIDSKGKILALSKIKNLGNAKKILESIIGSINDIVKDTGLIFSKDIIGIGLSIASPNVNIKTGQVNWNKTIPFSKNFNLKKYLEKKLKKRVVIENDLNAVAFAEFHLGCMQDNSIVIAISTGIGAGIVINGDIYRGKTFAAGEIGHMFISSNSNNRCTRGDKGCWEALASGKAVEANFSKVYKQKMTAKDIVLSAKKNDKRSLRIIKDTSYFIGIGISNIINILDPEVIVIYGSFFLSIWPLVGNNIKKVIKERSFNPKIKILKTKLGDNGGILGAALLVFNSGK